MKSTYKEVLTHIRPISYLSYLDNKVAAFIVYKFQNLPLTANFITFLSFLLVLAAMFFLLVFNFKIIFILLLIIAYTFDNVDGIWARLKNQTSEFGKFFDGFMDSVKYIAIDIGLIIIYFDKIQIYIRDTLVLVIIFSLYFALPGFYTLSYFQRDLHNKVKTLKLFDFTSGATRYFVIFPLVVLVDKFIILYLLTSFLMYTLMMLNFLVKRFNASQKFKKYE